VSSVRTGQCWLKRRGLSMTKFGEEYLLGKEVREKGGCGRKRVGIEGLKFVGRMAQKRNWGPRLALGEVQ